MSKELGDLIRRKRKDKGWTQTQLADRLGVQQVTVSEWETGRNTPSKVAELQKELGLTGEEVLLAMATGIDDDPVVRALMVTSRIGADVRDALLTLYREAALAHQRQRTET